MSRLCIVQRQFARLNLIEYWLKSKDVPALTRTFTNKPESLVYGGPVTQNPKRVTLQTLRKLYADDVKITMVTAYDYPSAVHVRPSVDFFIARCGIVP